MSRKFNNATTPLLYRKVDLNARKLSRLLDRANNEVIVSSVHAYTRHTVIKSTLDMDAVVNQYLDASVWKN
jgi:hypothetical protein